jgi:hypothetical protein
LSLKEINLFLQIRFLKPKREKGEVRVQKGVHVLDKNNLKLMVDNLIIPKDHQNLKNNINIVVTLKNRI